ncbi:tRNA (adenosine(37)-N6)-threonylcarbamoyltransferase complex ATPase subunit type 1 TsaE [Delftia sp. PS-11]|uniref:tRNA (adenosine(37)-N6)-threonylcarbamoyltransferase complex ATPase subunit type 1 TsaE n=1 Tax=Delftia sp. PS-11 TaxID=2767222 RepID=UPI0024567917|nr:tRNA (adenosine(37)-N6)-threonylcarbamoyltransferase complex ATPase subunit type 1 TsaE [Delftia sp. PS-11]KAJ8745146.1 tRNA (adenosine(37)-N6)-threonylcarbamoyltransferase complex ATPase subunit type 1 TsaE [Delftia sp. PS-11]
MTAAQHTPPIVESGRPQEAGTACHRWIWHGEEDTQRFAQRLAAQPGLRDAYVTLHGDLGAGKTTLVRHWLRALGVQGRIKSPTYAVVEPHEAPGLAIWHFDFYRFDDPREWEDAGFRDIFASPGLKLAEWPEKAAALTPVADIALHIEAIDEIQRQVSLSAGTPVGRAVIQALQA